ncbi:hypothetical protein SDC9_207250 [bioreactor metagenome]|uniref:Uncharacterized protein n=1 Tax=bioreactor metagenome TaxID=1076179 RepID=A0A645J9X1_9ZZZZ
MGCDVALGPIDTEYRQIEGHLRHNAQNSCLSDPKSQHLIGTMLDLSTWIENQGGFCVSWVSNQGFVCIQHPDI